MSTKENPATTTWYCVNRWSDEIKERQVTKHTAQTIWYLDVDWHGNTMSRVRQERKGGDWFQTKAEAITEQRRRLERDVESASARLAVATKKLDAFNLKHAGRDPVPA